MTDKELKRLRRDELLELLVEQGKKVEELQKELEEARSALNSRELLIRNAGSIAEAALQVNGVFEAAQAAAEQYLENIRRMSGPLPETSPPTETEDAPEAGAGAAPEDAAPLEGDVAAERDPKK